MKKSLNWPKILLIVGFIGMLIGMIDPLEGSVVILAGSFLVAISAFLGKSKRSLIHLSLFWTDRGWCWPAFLVYRHWEE